ncbi:MAG TPA: hypothetical protein VGN90_14965 [Pyrinomonadaceae bacterium]|jgi:hypothetical protein|nr:hypothetical protein [Pyrinomonadaceae bacterium]
MSVLDETRFLERFQFFNGQRLFASDLQGADDFNREMRWLHNRSLHQPGIGNGFAVYGKRNDREVVIGAGYAIDAFGREIVLTSTVTQQVPPVAGDDAGEPVFYDLTVSYPDDSALEETETRQGLCSTYGVVRRREVPVFCWVRLNQQKQPIDERLKQDILKGMRLIVTRAEVLNCQLNSDLSVAERRDVRPSRLPYIVCGEETPTAWEVLTFAVIEPATGDSPTSTPFANPFVAPVGLTATIKTADAGFQINPVYNARIAGSRRFSVGKDDGVINMVVDELLNIREESVTATQFTVDVMLLVQPFFSVFGSLGPSLRGPMTSEDKVRFLAMFKDWRVVWMGVES